MNRLNDRVEFRYEESWAMRTAVGLGEINPKEAQRVQQTATLIPYGVRTVLDAGCGDGRVTAALAGRCRVVGLDVSASVLRHGCGRNCVAGRLTELPFSDGCFDLVLISEVIEHVPLGILQRVLAELRRVALKYILITVPYRETLADAEVRCGTCDLVFHKWGHIQSFDERTFSGLYPDLKLSKTVYLGAPKAVDPAALKRLRQCWGGRYAAPDADTICPKCGGRFFLTGRRNLASMALGAVSLALERLLPPRQATWIGGVFEKNPEF